MAGRSGRVARARAILASNGRGLGEAAVASL